MINPVLQSKLSEVTHLLKAHMVKRAYAFGSVCTDYFNDQSDVDFIVVFDDVPLENYADNFFELEDELKEILKRDVDVVTEKTLKNPFLIEEINKTKTLLYG